MPSHPIFDGANGTRGKKCPKYIRVTGINQLVVRGARAGGSQGELSDENRIYKILRLCYIKMRSRWS